MTGDLHENILSICTGNVAFLGIGNTDCGDDGAGIILCRMLQEAGIQNVFEAGERPESVIPHIRDHQFDSVVFLDAVDAHAIPGSIVIMDALDIAAKYPQISTHKLSLGTLASLVASGPEHKVSLIGIQPESIAFNNGKGLSAPVIEALHTLAQHLSEAASVAPLTLEEHLCN